LDLVVVDSVFNYSMFQFCVLDYLEFKLLKSVFSSFLERRDKSYV